MSKLLLAFLLLMNLEALAQNTPYDTLRDPENGRLTYKGPVTFDDLNKQPLFTWEKTNSAAYEPVAKEISFLENNLKEYSIVVFMGTWCGDSHEMIPKLEKVLQKAGYPLTRVTMFGVDRPKTTKNGEEKKYDVKFVPTIILFNNEGKEAGRITENVMKSVEADMADIIEKDKKIPVAK